MRRAPADALRALAEMPIAGSPPRLSTHPDRFLAVSHPPSRSALISNPHSARCPAAAQLPATSCLGAFWDACQLSVPRPSLLPASKNLHNLPASKNLHNLPASKNLHNLPSSKLLHNLPASNNLHNLPASKNLHNLPASKNLHNLPASKNLHNLP